MFNGAAAMLQSRLQAKLPASHRKLVDQVEVIARPKVSFVQRLFARECLRISHAGSVGSVGLRKLLPCTRFVPGGGGGGVLSYKGLMGTCGQPGYVFRDFCFEQGIEFIIFCLNQGIDLSIFVLNWVKCLKQGIKNRNSVLKWVGKSAIFVLNRVRV